MKNRFILIALLLAFSIGISTCYYDSKEYLYPQINTVCDTTNVTFSVSVKKILTENCLTCHSSSTYATFGGDLKLETYTDVVNSLQNNRLMGAIRHEPGYVAMPKNGGMLSDCKITTIQLWIDAQAPNN